MLLMTTSKRKFRFSVRRMLVGVAFICLTLWWLSWFNGARRQELAAAKVSKLGGAVVYGYEYQKGWTRRLTGSPIRPPLLHNLFGIDAVDSVYLVNLVSTEVDDDGLAFVRGFPDLQILSLDSSRVTDAGLQHFSFLPDLQYLYLNCSRVTDAGLVHLSRCPKLERLQLSAAVTDKGISHLRRYCPNLIRLDIDCPEVTDAAIDELLAMPSLEALRIRESGFSDVGLERIQKNFRVQLLPPHHRTMHGGALGPMGW